MVNNQLEWKYRRSNRFVVANFTRWRNEPVIKWPVMNLLVVEKFGGEPVVGEINNAIGNVTTNLAQHMILIQ